MPSWYNPKPPFHKSNPTAALLLLAAMLLLTLVLAFLCIGTIEEGFNSSRKTISLWTTFAMGILGCFMAYRDWQGAIKVKRARDRKEALEEGREPPEDEEDDEESRRRARRRQVAICAAVVAIATIGALAQLLYPTGPSQGWQFSVASAFTALLFLVITLLENRKKD